ncbi:LysR family transcriptional regulator [Frischella perrara]|uniref:LysR family transcriptional regulator n=1 Tax=Frischella perrara TaxID=1267021 RepID=UPI0023F3905B|nr:LysR family transcriptional regulator [Frischella perrara]MCT6875918.1 LysR family transcriptional regulator [Frischella perrara]
MKLSLDDLLIFINVIKEGSIVKASKKLSISSATISRRLTQLEEAIEGRLIHRSSRKITLTTLGRIYSDKLTPLLEEFVEVTENLDEYHHKLSGTIRITAPTSLTYQWLTKCIFSFMKAYPSIKIDLLATNRILDLDDMNIDIAIRVGNLTENDWIAKKLLVSNNILCASKAYISQINGCLNPVDLLNKNLINSADTVSWLLTNIKTEESYEVHAKPYLIIDDTKLIIDAAKEGLGICFVPSQFVTESIDKDELEVVLPDWGGNSRPIYLLFKDRNYLPKRVRLFKEYIENYISLIT